jgi:ferritin-like metal-binding protein YciE
MSPETELMSWLRDAHAMEMQAIQILQNQARRIENYPDLRNRILEHLEETRAQAEMLELHRATRHQELSAQGQRRGLSR